MNWFLIINDTRCKQELEKFFNKHKNSILVKHDVGEMTSEMDIVLKNLRKQSAANKQIALNSANNVTILKVGDIIHCQSFRSYTQIHLNNGTEITVTKTLKEFEQYLKKYQFVRIHQSYLVNMSYVVRYNKGHGGCLVLRNGNELPVATRKREQLFKELEII